MTKEELINELGKCLESKREEYTRNHLECLSFVMKDSSEKTTDELVEVMRRNAFYEGQIRLSLEITRILKRAYD